MSAIGVRIRDADLSLADMCRLATIAEGARYQSAWLPESMGRDAIAELIALVGATKRITVGTGIVPVRNLSTTLRHRRFLFTDSFLLLWKWRVG